MNEETRDGEGTFSANVAYEQAPISPHHFSAAGFETNREDRGLPEVRH